MERNALGENFSRKYTQVFAREIEIISRLIN